VGTTHRVLDLVDVDAANQFVRHLAEATLTWCCSPTPVRVNLGRLRRESALPVRLLGVGLPLTIAAGTLAGLALFPQLNLWTAAALATILAPTDAALGLPVVSNKRLPSRIRQGLNVESGGAGGDRLRHHRRDPRRCSGRLGPALVRGQGVDGGDLAADQRHGHPAVGLLGRRRAGGSGFIAAFVAGIVFGAVAGDRAEHSTFLAEQSGELLNAVTFLLFGLARVLLGLALGELDWRVAGQVTTAARAGECRRTRG
jgi:hypothetical protein